MDTIYSWTLLAALIAGSLALVLVVLGLIRQRYLPDGRAVQRVAQLRNVAKTLVAATLVLLSVSVGVHATYGHGPASIEPMPLPTFVAEHPVFLFPLAMAILALIFMPDKLA